MVAVLEVTEMGDSLTNWLTALIAFASLCAFLRLTQKQIEIQKQQANIAQKQGDISYQQLALLQRQDLERLSNLKKANISYQLTSNTEKSGPYQYLIIKNDGPSEARNIEVKLGGKSLKECTSLCIMPNERIEKLSPNSNFKYGLHAGTGVKIPNKIALHWSDDSGEERSLEGSLSFS
jgi:hypothetical protein